jgi:hypothetical protein
MYIWSATSELCVYYVLFTYNSTGLCKYYGSFKLFSTVYVVDVPIMCMGYAHNAFCASQPPHPAPLAPAAAPQSSVVRPPNRPRLEENKSTKFSREATEVFSSYRVSGQSERICDNMLGWASHDKYCYKYRGYKVGYKTMRTLSRHAAKQYLPSGVESSNFTEK